MEPVRRTTWSEGAGSVWDGLDQRLCSGDDALHSSISPNLFAYPPSLPDLVTTSAATTNNCLGEPSSTTRASTNSITMASEGGTLCDDLDELLSRPDPWFQVAIAASSSANSFASPSTNLLDATTNWGAPAAAGTNTCLIQPSSPTSSEGAALELNYLLEQMLSANNASLETATNSSTFASDATTTATNITSCLGQSSIGVAHTVASEVAMGGSDLDELPYYSENSSLQVANIASSPHNLFASPSTFPSDAPTNISVPPTTSAEGADLDLDAMERLFASSYPCFVFTSPSTFLSDISCLDQPRTIMASEGVMVEFRDRMWTRHTIIALDHLSTDSFITSPAIFPSGSDAETTTASATPSSTANTSGVGTRWESSSVRDWERVSQALTYLRETQRDNNVLVQVWVPTRCGDGLLVLTMTGQPFTVDQSSDNLLQFEEVPPHYPVSADLETRNSRYLPSPERLPWRAFIGKLRSRDGRPFIRYEWNSGFGGTLGLPMFDRRDRALGVLELVSFRDGISFVPELDTICSALQAIKLTAAHVSSIPRTKFNGASYIDALPEILQVLKAACIIHGLPLAQTWVACAQQAKRDGHHSDENYRYCISTIDAACYVNDPRMQFFHEAWSEHHLLPGQGVAGKAFATNQPCFLTDVGSLSEHEYPLSHHAKIFRLKGVMAIRLRSTSTGMVDFVLEFYLPTDSGVLEKQKAVLDSLWGTVQTLSKTLRMVTDKEMEDDAMWGMNLINSVDLKEKKKAIERKPMARRSHVWKSFTEVMVGDTPKAKCNYCDLELCCDSKTHGTSSLKSHLKRCKHNPDNRITGPL